MNIDIEKAKQDLKNVRLFMGKERKIITQHRNEVLNADYAALNKNIQINIAKLEDAVKLAEESNKEVQE